jgi:hypothetical protein
MLFAADAEEELDLLAAILQTHAGTPEPARVPLRPLSHRPPSQQVPARAGRADALPERSSKARMPSKPAKRRGGNDENIAPAAANAPAPKKRAQKPLVASAAPPLGGAREDRRKRRDAVVFDPCQSPEQRRLLQRVLPRMQGDAASRIGEEPAASAEHVLHLREGDRLALAVGGRGLRVGAILGEGRFGKVHSVRDAEGRAFAMKVSQPPQLWEWYIHTELRARLPPADGRRLVLGSGAFLLGEPEATRAVLGEAEAARGVSRAEQNRSASLLLLPLAEPSLDALVRAHRERRAPMGEACAAFLAADLLRGLASLHAADVLHCDVRPDNVSLRLGTDPSLIDVTARVGSGDGGWEAHGIALLDFGRALDVRQYAERGLCGEVAFSGDVMADGYECVEMRRRAHWTIQIDTYAAAATIDALLHAHVDDEWHMPVHAVNGRWQRKPEPTPADARETRRPGPALPSAMWDRLFDVLLNPGQSPELASLADELCAHIDATFGSRKALKRELQQQQEWMRAKQPAK